MIDSWTELDHHKEITEVASNEWHGQVGEDRLEICCV